MKNEKSLGFNALLNGLRSIISVLFPLITYPYALRTIQVDNIGKVDFANSIVGYFILLSGLGISTYAVREGAALRKNKISLENFSREIFTLNAISSMFSIVLLFICIVIVPRLHDYFFIILIQGIQIVSNWIGMLWLYTIVEDYMYMATRSLIVHFAALVLLVIYVRTPDDYLQYAAANVMANAGAAFLSLVHSRKYIKIGFRRTSIHALVKHMKPIMLIFVSNLASTIYVNSDKTILGFWVGDYYVGLYSVAVNVYTVLKTCIAAIIMVSLPRLSNHIANYRKNDYQNDSLYIFKMFMTFLVPIVIGVFLVSDDIVILIGGTSYAEASTALRILSISLVFSMLATFYTNAVLIPMKREKEVLVATILSAFLNVGLNFVLLRTYKQDGAALTTLLAELIMFLYQYMKGRSYIKLKVSGGFYCGLLLGCVGIYGVVYSIDTFLGIFPGNLLVKIFFSAIIYFSILLLFKNDIIFPLIHKLTNHLR